jgi:hypothetical protein
VPSHIRRRKSQLTSCINSHRVLKTTLILQISICSISKQCGVPTQTPSTRETPVSTPTTGKISGGNLIFLTMRGSSARNGRRSTLCKHMRMAARMSTGASSLMGGRSKSIILLTIRSMLADKGLIVKSLTVPTTTVRQIGGTRSVPSTDSSQETVEAPQAGAITLSTSCTSQSSSHFSSTRPWPTQASRKASTVAGPNQCPSWTRRW